MIDYTILERYISQPRLNRYLLACNNKQQAAVALYECNLTLSQAFLPLLTIVEVAVRNSINTVLEKHFGDAEWIISQKAGFMSDASLTYFDKRTGNQKTNRFLKTEVERAEHRLAKRGESVTAGKVIAEQNFGFWTDLYSTHHYKLLRGAPVRIFTGLPAAHGRKEVFDALTRIRIFRNRIYHNEPICFSGSTKDFHGARIMHKTISDILEWMHTDLHSWSFSFDKAAEIIDGALAPVSV